MNQEQRIQFENLGFLHLPGYIPPELVRRLGRAFDTAADRYRGEWRDAITRGSADPRYCDIPDILDADDAFIDVVDIPKLVPLLLGAVGDDVQLNHTHARLFPPGKTFTAAWHSDMKHVLGIAHDHCPNFFVKVHYFFEDLEPDQGCLAFLPGTHRLPVGYPKPAINDPHNSSAVVKIVPKAGDCVMFNTHVLHMALDNKSEKIRKSLIYAYSHFWLKNYANSVPRDLARVATTPLRRQLFGIDKPGVNYFDQRYSDPTPVRDAFSTFTNASKRLLYTVYKNNSLTARR
jgi:phytanoyl-CoA hydroxylase